MASNKRLKQPVVIHSGYLKKHMQHRTHDPVRTQAKQHRQLKQCVNGDIATGSIIGGLEPNMCSFVNCLDCF